MLCRVGLLMSKPYQVALELQPCIGQRSGIGNYVYELAKRFKNDNALQFSGNVFNFVNRNDNASGLDGIKIPISICNIFSYGVYRRLWHWLPVRYNQLFPVNADLSLFFNYIVPPRISGKVLTTIHDLTWLRYPETMDKKNLQRIEKDINYSIERADRILTVSEFSKQEMVSLLKLPAEKIAVVPCASAEMPGGANFAEFAKSYNLDKPYLLYIGNLEPRKNLSRLLQAFDLLKEELGVPHQLVIAGGSGWCNDKFQQALQKMKHFDDVVQVGYVETVDKRALYENAAVFVFPSLYEGFGIPPLEAMSCGCPVVCAKAASLPEVVGDAAELMEPLSVQSIAAGIWRVIGSEQRSAELVYLGYEQARKYSWDKSAEQLKAICREILGV